MIATIMGLDTLARESWDVLVVGAGPAGALAARQLALHGDRVLLVDRKTFPRWKVCGACVNGHALSVLRIVGLSGVVQQLRAVPLRRFSLWNSGRELTLSLPTGVAVSRERFDTELVKAAVTAGACFSPATTATVAGAEGPFRRVRLRGERQTAEVAARLVLVADGLGHPSLAAHPEFRMKRTRQTRIGCGTSLPQAPAGFNAGTIYMGVSRHGYVGMVRLEDGSLNVAAAIEPTLASVGSLGQAAQSMLAEAEIAPQLDPAMLPDQVWRGTAALTQRPTKVFGDRVFVLGDAAGYVEPFTGEGIAWALESAAAVAPLAHAAASSWRDELGREWTRTHRRLIGSRQWLCSTLAWGLRCPSLVRSAMSLMSWAPAVAARLVASLNAPAAYALKCETPDGCRPKEEENEHGHCRDWNSAAAAADLPSGGCGNRQPVLLQQQ